MYISGMQEMDEVITKGVYNNRRLPQKDGTDHQDTADRMIKSEPKMNAPDFKITRQEKGDMTLQKMGRASVDMGLR